SALEQDGPILSVYLDTTRTDPNAAAELSIRWEQLRTQMVSEGAPTALLDDIHRTVQLPSAIGGRHGRAILASSSQILVDRLPPAPPAPSPAPPLSWSPGGHVYAPIWYPPALRRLCWPISTVRCDPRQLLVVGMGGSSWHPAR